MATVGELKGKSREKGEPSSSSEERAERHLHYKGRGSPRLGVSFRKDAQGEANGSRRSESYTRN